MLKYQFCTSLDTCIVTWPYKLTKYTATEACNKYNISKCSGNNICCMACLSEVASNNKSSFNSVSLNNKYANSVQAYIIIACVYFLMYFILLCLTTIRCKTKQLQYIKSISISGCLILTVLLLLCAHLGLIIYLSFEWQTVKKCQPNLVTLIIWVCVILLAFIDFISHLFRLKNKKKDTSELNKLRIFSFLSCLKKFACIVFNKIMCLCVIFYLLIIIYFELLLENVFPPIKI